MTMPSRHKLDVFETEGIPGYQSVVLIPEGQDPPSEFCAFRKGANDTTKGVFTFDKKSAAQVIELWKSRGIDLMGDYEHMSLVEPPIIAPASTRKFDLEVRNGALWVTNIKWTKRAWNFIKEGEYRYTSMAFDVDVVDEDGEELLRISRVLNFALTNLPAANNIPSLVAARERFGDLGAAELAEAEASLVRRRALHAGLCLKAVAYEKCPVVDGPWDAAASVRRARDFAGVKSADDLQNPAAQKKYAAFFGYVGGDGKKFGDYLLPHHDVANGKMVTSKKGVQAAGNAIQGGHGSRPSIPAVDLPAVKRHLGKHYAEWGAKAPWDSSTVTRELTGKVRGASRFKTLNSSEKKMKFLDKIKAHMDDAETDVGKMAEACGMDEEEMQKMLDSEPGALEPDHQRVLDKLAKHLKVPVEHLCSYAMGHDPEMDDDEDDDEDDDKEDDDDKELKSLKSTVLTLTGKKDISEAKAVLQAMKTTHDKSSDLSKQVAALTDEIGKIKGREHKTEFDRLVDQAKKDGKLSPAEVASTKEGTPGEFIAACKADGDRGIKSLRSFLSALPAKVRTKDGPSIEPKIEIEGLTEEDLEVARKMGVDPKKLAETKKGIRTI